MIQLHYWPTPNGHKVTLFLEEAGLPYELRPVDIGAGDQFKPEFLAISPNNKMPAIVDREPADGGAPLSVFESGAILLYLAEKTGRFLPADLRGRNETLEWLFWQMAGLGPMTGQYGHFHVYAPEAIDYAKDRYRREVERLMGVLDRRLAGRGFIAGDALTIADMACHPWIDAYTKAPVDLAPYPELRRWHAAVGARPAVQRAYAVGKTVRPDDDRPMTDAEKKRLFGGGGR
ncbi:MAG TPA: glutathione S-transferase N-terminal domain-containing protein [Xanthomonadaceae bacterium]|nr:glutathione S-transferase N-terminal domain-containing protein [Xanthomonadaceae bacterium]